MNDDIYCVRCLENKGSENCHEIDFEPVCHNCLTTEEIAEITK